MDTNTVIKVEDVSKIFKLPHEKTTSIKSLLINFRKRRTFEKQQALKNITFEVKAGEFFGIVGRNGSGKSTLLKLLAGIYIPTTGDIHVSGKLTPFIELGVGFNPELTGKENVYLNGALLGFKRQEVSQMYNDIVSFAELEKFMDQKLKNYSSGMQVRLAFSIAIRAQSDILLIDEVLAVGDAAFQQKCYTYFEELKQQKKTVVFVTHDMGAVQRFCDRGILVEEGNLKVSGSALDIAEAYREDNIIAVNAQQETQPDNGLNKQSSISVKIVKQDTVKKQLVFDVIYKTSIAEDVYVGFSLLRDGATFAEINSLHLKSKPKGDKLHYTLDTSMLNAGLYEISAALLKRSDKSPLAMTSKRSQFNIRGYDDQRGGPLVLKDTWEEDK